MNFKKSLATTLLALIFTGCGGSGSNQSSSIEGNQENSQTGQMGEESQFINFSASYNMNENSPFFGKGQLINYNNETKSIEVSAPFPLASLMPKTSGSLPNHPEITYETDPEANTITLIIPTENYIDLVENPNTLPDGRPLPDVNGGEPPSFGFPLNFLKSNAYGYAAFDSFSIFIESSLKLPINLELPIKSDQDGRQIGKLHWLKPENGHSGGVFLSVRLPKELSVILANAQ